MATSSTHTVTVKYSADVGAFVQKAGVLAGAVKRVNQSFRESTTTRSSGGGAFSGITTGLTKMVQMVNRTGTWVTNQFQNIANSVRLVSQGFMTLGKALTFALTPMAALVFVKSAQAAIDFDDALVRVSKTTGLYGEKLGELAVGLRDLSTRSATTAVDLAKMAEQVGQLGVRDADKIVKLTDIFNKLITVTNLSADEVSISMGRIANAFGMDLNTDEGVEQIEKFASVINELENQMEVSAPEIVNGMLNVAEVGNLLNFPPDVAAALVSALVAVGFEANEAGTSLRNLLLKVVQEADTVAELMKNIWGAVDAQDVLNKMNEDAAGTILDLIDAAAAGDQQVQSLFATMEVGGIRGGKGWAALAAGIDEARKALGISREEWVKGTSLQMEYERALLSTKNQLAVLKNNLTEVALSLGESLLPILNTAIQTLIPAIRDLAKWIKNLSPAAAMTIVKVVALAGVIGPAILLVSQLGFAVSMIAMAFGKLAAVVWSVVATGLSLIPIVAKLIFGFGRLGMSVLGLTKVGLPSFAVGLRSILGFIFSVKGAVLGLGLSLGVLLLKVTGIGAKIGEFFLNLADKASAWGETLIGTFAGGMMAGAARILSKVLTAIGNFIGKFFAGHSPPEVGPLSHIDKWGKNVFDAYLEGFLQADFGILKNVGSIIGKILQTFAKTGLVGDKADITMLLEARQNLAKLLDTFRKTGKISEKVLSDVVKNLGEQSDEVAELVRRWIKYEDIQIQLANLETRRTKTLDSYSDEVDLIAASNKGAEERVSLIRNAMRERDKELKQIAVQKRGLESQEKEAKSQLDLQQEMLDAMQEQDDIQLRLIDTLEKLGGKLGDLEFPELGGWTLGQDDEPVEDPTAEIVQGFLTLEEQIKNAGAVWEAFKLGFTGGTPEDLQNIYDSVHDIAMEELAPDALLRQLIEGGQIKLEDVSPRLQGIKTAFETGAKAKGIWEQVQETFVKIQEEITKIGDKFSETFGEGSKFQGAIEKLGELKDKIDELLAEQESEGFNLEDMFGGEIQFPPAIQNFIDEFTKAREELVKITSWFDEVWAGFGEQIAKGWEPIGGMVETIQEVIDKIWAFLGLSDEFENMKVNSFSLGSILAWVLNIIVLVFEGLFLLLSKMVVNIISGIGFVIQIIVAIVGAIIIFISAFNAMLIWLWGIIVSTVENIWKAIVGFFTAGADDAKSPAGQLVDDVVAFFQNLWDGAVEIFDKMWAGLTSSFETALTSLGNLAENLWEVISGWFEDIQEDVERIFDEIFKWLEGIWQDIIDIFGVDEMFTMGADLIQGFWDGMSSVIGGVLTWLSERLTEAIELFETIMSFGSPSKVTKQFGMWFMEGFAIGMDKGFTDIPDTLSSTIGTVPGMLTSLDSGSDLSETNNVGNITLHFGRDSVRSDDDIKNIAAQVERILNKKSSAYINYGGRG